jgi:DHA1 family multidrug resistance protein B-like MFS transporter
MKIRDWDRNLQVRLFSELAMNISYWMFFPFLTIYFSAEFGKNKAGFLLIFSQFFSVMANLMGGYCADRFGRKRMMVLSSFGQGISFLTFAFASSPWFQSPILGFIAFVVAGIFGSLYWPASQAMVADVVDEENRSEVFAIFYTAINIAVVVGPLFGAVFFEDSRFQLLLIAGIICLLLSLILTKWTRETRPVHISASADHSGKWYYFLKNQLQDYSVIGRDKTFLLYLLGGIFVGLTFVQLDLVIPIYIKDVLKSETLFSVFPIKGEHVFGIILAENGLLVTLFTVWVTKWMGKRKERYVFVLSSLIYAASIFLFSQTSSFWGFIAVMGLYTFGELTSAGVQQSFVAKLAPESMRGQYFAASSLRWTFSRMVAPIFIPMTAWIGYTWTFAVLTLFSVLSAGMYWAMFYLFEKQPAAEVSRQQ